LAAEKEITASGLANEHKERFLSGLNAIRANGYPEWAHALRLDERQRFVQTAFPHHKQEAWRFTNIAPIIETPFRFFQNNTVSAILFEEFESLSFRHHGFNELVFVDGFVAPDLSDLSDVPDGVLAMGLRDALMTCPELLRPHLDRHLMERDAFTALNGAFLQDGAFLYVPPNTTLEKPLHILFLTTGREENTVQYPRNLFVLGEGAEATIIETYTSLRDKCVYFNDVVSEAVLEEGSRLRWHKIVQEGPRAHQLGVHQFAVGRAASLETCVITLGGKITRSSQTVTFQDVDASCSLNGLYLNDGDRLVDNAIFIDHAQPRCTSRIAFRGVLDGTSNTAFTGRVLVRKGAQKTDSNQLSSNLLISDQATVDAKPQLQIYADDVKCTHGATVGHPPDELVFYFRTRGIDPVTARRILTLGFVREIVARISVPALRDRLDTVLSAHYSPLH
jgi:Fe-S cluster assembly protein SufD